ncbi:2 3-bisphosphoglycerate-dependent phosphoglycerate mutase [Bienertia sinuspersici]
MNVEPVVIEDLRERYFGPSYELSSHDRDVGKRREKREEGVGVGRGLGCTELGTGSRTKAENLYPDIWALDEKDPFEQPEEGGESAADVVTRLVKAMEQMETLFEGCAILIVSHGDPLQMLQTILSAAKEQSESSCSNFLSKLEAVKVPSILSKHRKFALETGELRAVV